MIQFQELEDELNTAFESNDAARISTLLSDDWTILESSTGISNKQQFLKAIEERKLSHTAMRKQVTDFKTFNDTAVVITRGKNVGRYQETEFNSEQWVTNIYRKINSRWLCVFTQETPVSCD